MRVLQLISTVGFYGAESMLLNLIAGGSSEPQNHLAVFCNSQQPNRDLYERAIRSGVKATIIPCRGKADRQALQDVQELIRANQIDVLHTHGYKSDLYGYVAARREGKPIVATCHNWLSGGMLATYNILDRIALKRFDAVVAVSQVIADRLAAVGVAPKRLNLIPNGIEMTAFQVSAAGSGVMSESGQTLGVVARLDLKKGFEYLLGAAATLRRSFPALRILIVGEGPDRPKIEAMIRKHGLKEIVTLAGEREDMPAVYASIDIFVLPSLNEGLPMTVLEAMAASKPVIATRVGAIPGVICDGETGLLINAGDQAGLAMAISQLLNAPERARALGQRAHSHVQQYYAAATMRRRYSQMYEQVLARRICSPTTPTPALVQTSACETVDSEVKKAAIS